MSTNYLDDFGPMANEQNERDEFAASEQRDRRAGLGGWEYESF